MRLKEKTALITGGSKGIGKAIAKTFVREGASVIICGRDEKILRNACEEISNHGLENGKSDYIKADIVNRDDVRNLAAEITGKWHKLDILVNNASILGDRASILEYPEDVWERVIQVNLNAQFFVSKALLPLLLRSRSGSIINVSSSVGRQGKGFWGAYAVSKFGLEGLTQVLADELKASCVRVNSVNPGGTRTGMRAEAYPDEDPMTLPAPEDIVPVFLYLASDESAGITGNEFNAREWIGRV